jgi:hypothetical protein
MVSHLFYYQLALFALVWLSVMLHVTGSQPGLPTPPAPAKPKGKRSTVPKAFVVWSAEIGSAHLSIG